MLNKLLGTTFFQTVKPKLKVLIHFLELLVAAYFATAVAVSAVFRDPVLMEHCVRFAFWYLMLYPPAHLLFEMLNGIGPNPNKPTDNGSK